MIKTQEIISHIFIFFILLNGVLCMSLFGKKKKSLSPCLSVFKNWDGEGKLIVKKMKNMLPTLI
jgi:hypothetical protein